MILSSFWYHSGILRFLHVKFIADFRMMVMACSGHQFSLCRQFTYRTIILPTLFWFPPTTWAAIALQTHLAYPPPIPWPCATTTTLPSLTLSRFFMVSPVKTGTLLTLFRFF